MESIPEPAFTVHQRVTIVCRAAVVDAERRARHTLTPADEVLATDALTDFVNRGAMKFVLGALAHSDQPLQSRDLRNEISQELIDAYVYNFVNAPK
jgi:hypothetical protein